MAAGERKFGRLVERKRGARPTGRGMAGRAGLLQHAFVRVGMAGQAILPGRRRSAGGPHPLEPRSFGRVAGGAIDDRVAARQRVLGFGMVRDPVALAAFRGGRLVGWGGAGPAGGAGLDPGVALVAGRRFMEALQRIAGLFMGKSRRRLEMGGVVALGAILRQLAAVFILVARRAFVRQRPVADHLGRAGRGWPVLLLVALLAFQGSVAAVQPI